MLFLGADYANFTQRCDFFFSVKKSHSLIFIGHKKLFVLPRPIFFCFSVSLLCSFVSTLDKGVMDVQKSPSLFVNHAGLLSSRRSEVVYRLDFEGFCIFASEKLKP